MDNKLLRVVWRIARILFGVLVVVWIARLLSIQWREIRSVNLIFETQWLVWGSLALLAFYVLYVFSWIRIIRKVDESSANFANQSLIRVFFTAMVTRYLPAGKILNIGSRVELYRSIGGERPKAFSAVLIEQLYFVGGTIFLVLMAILFNPEILPRVNLAGKEFLIWAGCIGILLVLFSFDWLYSIAADQIRRLREAQLDFRIQWKLKFEMLLRFLIVNVFQGMAAFMFLQAVLPAVMIELNLSFYSLAAYPFSRFLGQLVGIVPGGLGVREGAYAVMMGTNIPVVYPLITAALMRLASMVIEIVFVLGLNFPELRKKLFLGAEES